MRSIPISVRIFQVIEYASLVIFMLSFTETVYHLNKSSYFVEAGLIKIIGLGVGAWLLSDLFSGLVHYLFDTYGDENTPFIGQHLIKSFRDHHTYPEGILEHDYMETNGSNYLAVMPFCLLNSFYWLPNQKFEWSYFLMSFCFWVIMTNQIHKWAHMANPPRWVRWLQKYRIILAPEDHQRHHTYPYNRFFCITNGWFNWTIFYLKACLYMSLKQKGKM